MKVLNRHLFYLALTYLKKGDRETAHEKLKEAQVVTGMNVDTFVVSEPYKNKEMVDEIQKNLQAIPKP